MIRLSNEKIRETLSKLLIDTLACIAAIGLGEAAIRLTGLEFPLWHTHDPIRGHALRPNTNVWQQREGSSRVITNEWGMRDDPRLERNPFASVRVAVLGDSYIEASHVEREKTGLVALIEKKLSICLTGIPDTPPAAANSNQRKSRSNSGIKVLNFGTSGYSTAQQLLTLQHQVSRFHPDVVLLAVTTGNDIDDNIRELKQDPKVPYYLISPETGALVLDNSFLESPSYNIRA